MILIPLLALFQAMSLHSVLNKHVTPNHSTRISALQVTLGSNNYECRNVEIMDNVVELQGTANTALVFDRTSHSSNGVESLLRIWNSTVEMDKLRLDGCVHGPNTLHHSYSSTFDAGAFSLFSIRSSTVRLSNSEMRIGSGQSPFVVLGRQDAENSEETMICVVGSVLRWTDWIVGATTSIVADSGNLGLSVSVVSCKLDSLRIGSWNGLLVDEPKQSTSNSDVVRIETLLSDCRLENVTGAAPNRRADGGSKLWRQRLLSNSISKSSSVLSGTVIRDFNDGGDLLCSNTTFTSCSTSTLHPTTRHSIETSLLEPYLRPNLRRHKSKDGRYEWTDSDFQDVPGFNFYAYRKGEPYYFNGQIFNFGSTTDTIHFTRSNFSNIDGTEPNDKYRQRTLPAICVRCPSSLFIDRCSFNNCSSYENAGAINIDVYDGFLKAAITSSSFDDCLMHWGASSVLYHQSHGILTLASSNLTYVGQTNQQQIIRSQGIIVANTQITFNGSVVTNAISLFYGTYQFRFSRFISDTVAAQDISLGDPNYHDEWAFFGCVSTSLEAHAMTLSGLSFSSIIPTPNQVIAESGSLQTILTTNPTVTTVFVKPGDFGSFDIEDRTLSLKGWTPKADSSPPSSQITKFAVTVKSDGECTISVIQLAPCSSSSTILTTNGICSLVHVVVDSVKDHTASLFIVSGTSAVLSFDTCKITNIVTSKANLVAITAAAQFSFIHSLFTNITTTECVVSAVDTNTVFFNNSFLTHVHRTTGSGPAAIYVSSASSLTLNGVVLHLCVSDYGNTGALHISTSSPASLSMNLTCFSNSGADTSPKDVFFDGLDEQECLEVLKLGIHVGEGPHFEWSKDDIVGLSSIQFSESSFSISTLPRYQAPIMKDAHHFHPSDIQIRDILVNLKPGGDVTLHHSAPLDTPLVQEPSLLINQSIDFIDSTFIGVCTYSSLKQNPATLSHSLFRITEDSSVRLKSFNVQVDCGSTSPMVDVDGTSWFFLTYCIVIGAVGSFHRPFLQSQGMVTISMVHLLAMTFNSHSCITMTGGEFSFTGDDGELVVSSAVNITTTGTGAFLSSRSSILNFNNTIFVNCSARSGGALFISDSPEITTNLLRFVNCSASEDGGGAFIDIASGDADLYHRSECSSCSARRGGGLFFLVSKQTRLTLNPFPAHNFFGRKYRTHSFENCRAEQGAGIFFDGQIDINALGLHNVTFNNWNQVGLGSDIFFAEGIVADDPDSTAESLKHVMFSTSRRSTDLTKHSHVFFAAHPLLSFDLPLPEFKLEGTDLSIFTPLTAAKLHSLTEITPYLHLKDEDGNLLEMSVFVESTFCVFERSFCTDQHLIISYDPSDTYRRTVVVVADQLCPIDDPVMLELGTDATIELKAVVFSIKVEATMMLLASSSAVGLVDGCTFSLDRNTERKVVLFEVVDGTLTLKNTIFKLEGEEDHFNDGDLFVSGAPLVLVSPSTSPSALPKIILDTVTFKRIKLDEGVEGLMVFDVSASVSVNDLKFLNCNQTQTEETTRIVMTGRNLGQIDTSKWNGFSYLTPSDTLNWGIDSAEPLDSGWREVPLVFILMQYRQASE
ncbi:hypothetical protein BLNAU_10536 [Blattamonas nauphoetae]|uniref:Membrane-associated protein n=1 Tax=Blattamonas nauphoetae TaxID=2049346 RepID=A0ABQ9XQ05_9EUKA|nr:hypothetical protein BLNAU_10536 [Blattamonas nauphoetae]